MREFIKTNNLVKKYGQNLILDNVTITVNQGEIYGLVGDNGAGKTTLFRILSGQSYHSDGSYELLGLSGEKEIIKARKRIGAMIENPSFYPNMTIEQNLEY